MGLKKRSEVNAQFNMSSLTDIIFLLLIFFMLTSTLVAPNALNLKLPSSSSQRTVEPSDLDQVSILQSGTYFLNGSRISFEDLEQQLSGRMAGRTAPMSMTIAPKRGTPVEYVVQVMDLAMRLDINGVLVTEGK